VIRSTRLDNYVLNSSVILCEGVCKNDLLFQIISFPARQLAFEAPITNTAYATSKEKSSKDQLYPEPPGPNVLSTWAKSTLTTHFGRDFSAGAPFDQNIMIPTTPGKFDDDVRIRIHLVSITPPPKGPGWREELADVRNHLPSGWEAFATVSELSISHKIEN
jgi:hypothetical protein